jgi:hypothetical protein
MTTNPIDMQVMLPQTGQVNRVHRGLQKMQQTEEQILGQMHHQDIREKEATVKKTEQSLQKKVQEEKDKRRERNAKNKGKTKQIKEDSSNDDSQSITKEEKLVGGLLDIKV